MTQLNDSQMRLLARAIMPDLYRLQERNDRRRERKGASYRIDDPDDMEKIRSLIEKTETAPNYFQRN